MARVRSYLYESGVWNANQIISCCGVYIFCHCIKFFQATPQFLFNFMALVMSVCVIVVIELRHMQKNSQK